MRVWFRVSGSGCCFRVYGLGFREACAETLNHPHPLVAKRFEQLDMKNSQCQIPHTGTKMHQSFCKLKRIRTPAETLINPKVLHPKP